MTAWAFVGAVVVEVHDGDTLTVNIITDVGFENTLIQHRVMRILGTNARELTQPGGVECRDWLRTLLPVGAVVGLASVKPDKYAPRYLAKVTLPDGRDLAAVMIEQNWAAPWNGVGVKPIPPWPRP